MEYYGWNGKVLNVDLTSKTVSTEPLDPDMARKYVGGVGFGVKYIYDEVQPGTDALDPEAPLVFTTGPLTNTDVPSSGAYVVVAKSPLTNTITQAGANGFFGCRLKSAGYDVVIVRGKAEKPVYLWINNDQVEIRDASHVWGLGTHETEEMLKAEVGKKNASVACIGPAGENMVRYAGILNDFGHIASSGGCGAVMGSKNLKAIVAFGNQKPRIFDQERATKLITEWVETVKNAPAFKPTQDYGTAGSLGYISQIGDLPTKNFTTNIYPEATDIDGVAIRSKYKAKIKPCYKCPINHVNKIQLPEEKYGGRIIEEPEYEGIAALGPCLGITDLTEILVLNDLADDTGLDIKTLEFVIGLCMECYEKGFLSKEQLDGIELNWGNSEGAMQIIQKISRKEGIGVLLGENLRTIAETIGGDALEMVVELKGGGIHAHDVRSLWGYMMNHAISDFGTTFTGMIEFGPDPITGEIGNDPLKRDGHALTIRKTIPTRLFFDVAIVCAFNVTQMGVTTEHAVDTLSAVTGVDYTMDEFNKAMYRIENLARAFNIRHGLTPEDDIPSERMMSAPVDGPVKGRTIKPYIRGMNNEYYRTMGWDEKTSKPLRRTLMNLDLDFVIKDLWG